MFFVVYEILIFRDLCNRDCIDQFKCRNEENGDGLHVKNQRSILEL